MDWFYIIPYGLIVGGLTGILVLLHKRVHFLERNLLKVSKAYLDLEKGVKLMSEMQKETTKMLRKIVEAVNESKRG